MHVTRPSGHSFRVDRTGMNPSGKLFLGKSKKSADFTTIEKHRGIQCVQCELTKVSTMHEFYGTLAVRQWTPLVIYLRALGVSR